MKGKDLGYPERHPFHDAEVISVYTSDQAVEDGIKIQLGARLSCSTNFAHTVASKWFVKKHREIVAGPFDTQAKAMHAVHRLQPQSAEWAMKHDGYSSTWPGPMPYPSEQTSTERPTPDWPHTWSSPKRVS